jgi:hypothetical protein
MAYALLLTACAGGKPGGYVEVDHYPTIIVCGLVCWVKLNAPQPPDEAAAGPRESPAKGRRK